MAEIVYDDMFNPKPYLDSLKGVESEVNQNSSQSSSSGWLTWTLILSVIGAGLLLISIKPKIEAYLERLSQTDSEELEHDTRFVSN